MAQPIGWLKIGAQKWLENSGANYEVYQPEFSGFTEALKIFREKSSDFTHSKFDISLPFAVETPIFDKPN